MLEAFTTRHLAEALLVQEPPFRADEVRAVCRALLESERQRAESEALVGDVRRWLLDAFAMNLEHRIEEISRRAARNDQRASDGS